MTRKCIKFLELFTRLDHFCLFEVFMMRSSGIARVYGCYILLSDGGALLALSMQASALL